jgi:hypothetical protein
MDKIIQLKKTGTLIKNKNYRNSILTLQIFYIQFSTFQLLGVQCAKNRLHFDLSAADSKISMGIFKHSEHFHSLTLVQLCSDYILYQRFSIFI